ncbi:MAG: NAD(P)-dependent oxidoreductase [Actinobacteria bacterium]|nr:NAD(P)-dependent oxidoreductase [Actinomycetota bacterium]
MTGGGGETRCGVLGVGVLGAAIAERLAAQGLPVSAYDIDPDRVAALAAHGVAAAGSPRELAASSDVVLLLLPDTPEVLAALEGPDGLEAGLGEGSAVLLASTVTPATPQELAARLAPLGVELLDTPVSGGPVAAREGSLAIMVGGSEAGYERARPLLEAVGRPIHVGPVGHGEIAKLANNLMGTVTVLGIAEGLALAAKAGADLDKVREAIGGGSGSSWILQEWMPRTVLAGSTEANFAVRLMAKDMRLVGEYADQLGVPHAAGELARETFDRVRDEGYGDRDFSVLVALRAAEAGAPLEGLEEPG